MGIVAENDLLILRTWHKKDCTTLYELNNDAEVLKYTGDLSFGSIETAKTFIENYKDFALYNCGRWMVDLHATNESLGWCGIKFHPKENYYDLGFRIFRRHWGKGYATQASMLAIEYAKTILKLNRITARAMNENKASIRVLEKLGFTRSREEADAHGMWTYFEKLL